MKAVIFNEFGGPEVLQTATLPQPVAGSGQVVVKVLASAVNPADLMMRRGNMAAAMIDLAPPYIPGMEFTGHIHAVGTGVTIAEGTPVLGLVNPCRPAGGAYAQYITVPAASVAPLPEGIDLVAAVTVPMNALTAMLALDMTGIRPGQALLVTGGTGILGGLVLELARARGIRTVAAGREEDQATLAALGTDVILPRDGDLVAEVRKRYPEGVEAMIDGALIGQQVSAAVRFGGAAISLRQSHPIQDDRLKSGYVSVRDGMEDTARLQQIARLLAGGTLTARVASGGTFHYADATAAHAMVEAGGHRGRVIITMAE